jgi:hypothetical protein
MREQQKIMREEMKTRICAHHRPQTREEQTLHPDQPMGVYCTNLVATGHSHCSEHGGKTRKQSNLSTVQAIIPLARVNELLEAQ